MKALPRQPTSSTVAMLRQSFCAQNQKQVVDKRQYCPIQVPSTSHHAVVSAHKQIMGSQYLLHQQYPRTKQSKIVKEATHAQRESWSSKIAFAATLSSIITETAHIFQVEYSAVLLPKLESYNFSVAESLAARNKQAIYNHLVEDVFLRSEPFRLGITAAMGSCKILESLAMMKGMTDALCALILGIHDQPSMTDCDKARMHSLFESKLLRIWCSLLLRASSEIREGCVKYLKHDYFACFFLWQSALNYELAEYLSSDEKTLRKLRTSKEQLEFQANTKRYQDDFEQQTREARGVSVLPQLDRMYVSHPQDLRKTQKRKSNAAMDPRLRKKRKKSTKQLFRKDGTPRKQQQNPSQRRICKRMWQSDGINKGCGNNSHPRGVCLCWRVLGFKKKDEQDGTIFKWLEKRFGKKYSLEK